MDALRRYGFFALAAALAVASVTVTTGANAPYALIPQLGALMAACAGIVGWNTLAGVMATAVANLAMAVYLLQLKADAASGKSAACSINEVIDCGRVNSSAWSMFMGEPVSLWGMAVYGGILLAAVLAPTGAKRNANVDKIVAALSLFNVPFSLFLAYQSKVLGAFCVVCIAMYAGNFVLLWAGFKGLRERDAALFDDLGELVPSKEVMGFVGAFAATMVVGHTWFQNASALPSLPKPADKTASKPASDKPADKPAPKPEEPSLEKMFAELYQQTRGPVELTGKEPCLGPADAKYQVVEFADYGCPHCADAFMELKPMIAANPDTRLCYKYFPLSGACNAMLVHPDDPNPDPARCNASYAAECAHRQGKFWEMSHQLFTNLGHMAPDELAFMAKQVGVDPNAWEDCLADRDVVDTVQRSAKAGEVAGVQGTPTFYLKGAFGDQWIAVVRGPRALQAVLEAHRSGAALPPPPPPPPMPEH